MISMFDRKRPEALGQLLMFSNVVVDAYIQSLNCDAMTSVNGVSECHRVSLPAHTLQLRKTKLDLNSMFVCAF